MKYSSFLFLPSLPPQDSQPKPPRASSEHTASRIVFHVVIVIVLATTEPNRPSSLTQHIRPHSLSTSSLTQRTIQDRPSTTHADSTTFVSASARGRLVTVAFLAFARQKVRQERWLTHTPAAAPSSHPHPHPRASLEFSLAVSQSVRQSTARTPP
ncbi:hypothetical protein PMIN01_12251 [Paraphaeosphaeria minitans]|uniref:Uncharacterized protein n=1 Tax=Paraphaeosphaeria minitans TaxID=565426 RepID=A0A9P6G5S5_9PLEO|nr:hypothetical protein PMIN01_12251 [Paraphaeosphaeria minitans]